MELQMPLRPRLSEKAVASADKRTYVFVVPGDANKHSVADAVAAQFDVKVTGVNISVLKGKSKRTLSQKGRRQVAGRSSDLKKAYVTLAEGQKLPIFDAIEEEEAKQAETQEKLSKAAAKAAEKQAKDAAKQAKKEKK
jgi:large subunit ribosomal protein L23